MLFYQKFKHCDLIVILPGSDSVSYSIDIGYLMISWNLIYVLTEL